MRVPLRDGMWAELRERISHGAVKSVIRATAVDDLELMSAITTAYVSGWNVRDTDGQEIPFDAPDAFDRLTEDVAQALFAEVLPLWKGRRDTSPTPPSSDS